MPLLSFFAWSYGPLFPLFLSYPKREGLDSLAIDKNQISLKLVFRALVFFGGQSKLLIFFFQTFSQSSEGEAHGKAQSAESPVEKVLMRLLNFR